MVMLLGLGDGGDDDDDDDDGVALTGVVAG